MKRKRGPSLPITTTAWKRKSAKSYAGELRISVTTAERRLFGKRLPRPKKRK